MAHKVETKYETVIGLEVHAQLLTKSKMFCGCSADYANAPPNTHVCPVCLGMPGVLPVINRQAVEYTIMTGLALNCTVPPFSKFDRKNYPYPDLMKGYQISQYDLPLCVNGWLDIEADGKERRIAIKRVHLEEDTARLTHKGDIAGETYSLVDVNRAGTPLMEIVGEPDLRSAEEARQYLMKLRTILQYLGVSTGNMEEGSFRCDANISIRPVGSTELMTKVEVKNMNSFRAVYRALEHEAVRQRKVVEEGGRLVQETRGWVEEKGATVSQRSKEFAHDYRYFPEPDLPPLTLSRDWVDGVRARLPELPDARRQRFIAAYGLPAYDAGLLTGTEALADLLEACLDHKGAAAVVTPEQKQRAKTVSNWLLGEFSRLLNLSGKSVEEAKLSPRHLMKLLDLIDSGAVSSTAAKEVFEEMFNTGQAPDKIVAARGLTQLTDTSELESEVKQAIKDNPQAVADYKAGKQQAIAFLTGQVMRATRGRANAKLVQELLRKNMG